MNLLRFKRFDLLVSLGCLALLSSFAWYAWKGPRGFDYRLQLAGEIKELQAENLRLAKAAADFEKHVKLLRPESVDRDLLDQLARSELNMAPQNTLIVRDAQ